ncbi:MAG: potassium-transporting ATPase subunit KdpA [Phycisphaerales bacterium]|nr:potassium-transporting ATPase subunit KdpA [Phycisphaerales bacterium]
MGALWAVSTTATSNGSVNAMHDSLNPITALMPMVGMWLAGRSSFVETRPIRCDWNCCKWTLNRARRTSPGSSLARSVMV